MHNEQEKLPSMLIVDDIEINRVLLAQFFESEFITHEASNGREALDFLETEKVDIILLDLVMPEMDGFETLARLKQDERFAGIPVIVATAQSEGENEVRALEIGASDFITKPYQPTVVIYRVHNVMARMENEWRKAEQAAQAKQMREMRQAIEHDTLTGLYDRGSFYRRAEKMMRESQPETRFAIVYLNISSFKIVNDLLGMETGNLVLQTVAAYLKHFTKKIGIASRLEADHFAVCMPYETLDIEQVIHGIDMATESLGLHVRIQIYAGVYPVTNVFLSADKMCERAHVALNTVKGSVVTRYAVYDETMRARILREQSILREMDYALADHQFHVYLQPVHSIVEGKDIGAEALVRWVRPNGEIMPPQQFIGFFERNGFIAKLDHFVWEEACKLLVRQQDMFGTVAPISVNVSRINFYNERLVDEIVALVEKYGLNPQLLKLEVTESAYMDNPQQIIASIEQLRAYGFSVLMDDFGSGHSSLNMLRNMPIDVLKIDMRFLQEVVTDPRAAAILRHVVNMAHDIGMEIIIEGVETQEQVDFLREIGCDKMQGFFFAKPMPVVDYLARVTKMAHGIQ